jgi:hypothetical protein
MKDLGVKELACRSTKRIARRRPCRLDYLYKNKIIA